MNVKTNNTELAERRCLNDGGFFHAVSLSGGKEYGKRNKMKSRLLKMRKSLGFKPKLFP